jgi:hypothetical protein
VSSSVGFYEFILFRAASTSVGNNAAVLTETNCPAQHFGVEPFPLKLEKYVLIINDLSNVITVNKER